MNTGLETIDVCYPPHRKPCLHSLSFDISSCGITALVGESGSGKTTVLRILAGFMRPCAGTVYVNGREVASKRMWVAPEERQVGVLFQDYALFPHLTVEENILFGVSKKKSKRERSTILHTLLEVCDLERFGIATRYPHELSGGQMQRIALARSLAARPCVLILDEPFSNIDIELRERMVPHLKQIVQMYDMNVLYITHEKNEAFTVSHSLAIIRDGQLLQQGTARYLYESPVNSYVAKYFDTANIIPIKYDAQTAMFESPIGSFAPHSITTQHMRDVMLGAQNATQSLHACVRPHELCFTQRVDEDELIPCESSRGYNVPKLRGVVRVQEVVYYGGYYEAKCVSTSERFAHMPITVRCEHTPPERDSIVSVTLKDTCRYGEGNQLHVINE